eukprot:1141188-Pelagomonas_calceolata.AAC.9
MTVDSTVGASIEETRSTMALGQGVYRPGQEWNRHFNLLSSLHRCGNGGIRPLGPLCQLDR